MSGSYLPARNKRSFATIPASIFQTEIDPDAPSDPSLEGDLSDLQGNILTAHARDYCTLLLFRFNGDGAAARAFVREMAERVTSAAEQRRTYLDWKHHGIEEPTFFGFFLTHAGYLALGIDDPAKGLPADLNDPTGAFIRGMRSDESNLSPGTGDQSWDKAYLEPEPIDGAVMVADWSSSECGRAVTELVNTPSWLAAISAKIVEWGRSYRNRSGQRIEHFGYVDGVSNPLFLTDEIAAARAAPNAKSGWDPAKTKAIELAVRRVTYAPSPGAGSPPSIGYGSFLVFRKLEQDVAGFADYAESLAKRLNPTGAQPSSAEIDFAGGCLIGRLRDGTPMVDKVSSTGPEARNDFDYHSDPANTRCPMNAHIRRANSRSDSNNRFQIIRRGITYGERVVRPEGGFDETQPPAEPVGLLFMAYMASLDQFKTMQGWFNTALPTKNGTLDVIAGHADPSKSAPDLKIPRVWGQANIEPSEKPPFRSFTTARGGAYLFAPRLAFSGASPDHGCTNCCEPSKQLPAARIICGSSPVSNGSA